MIPQNRTALRDIEPVTVTHWHGGAWGPWVWSASLLPIKKGGEPPIAPEMELYCVPRDFFGERF